MRRSRSLVEFIFAVLRPPHPRRPPLHSLARGCPAVSSTCRRDRPSPTEQPWRPRRESGCAYMRGLGGQILAVGAKMKGCIVLPSRGLCGIVGERRARGPAGARGGRVPAEHAAAEARRLVAMPTRPGPRTANLAGRDGKNDSVLSRRGMMISGEGPGFGTRCPW